MTQIESDDHFANREENGRNGSSHPDIAEWNCSVGNEFENEREQEGNDAKREHKVYRFQENE